MIEDMFDEDLGLISASRSYRCNAWVMLGLLPAREGVEYLHTHAQNPDGLLARISGPLTEEHDCYACGRGPILWDRWHYQPYVLVPFILRETP